MEYKNYNNERYIEVKKKAYLVSTIGSEEGKKLFSMIDNLSDEERIIFNNTISFPNDLDLYDDTFYEQASAEFIQSILDKYNISADLLKAKMKEYITYHFKDIYEEKYDPKFNELVDSFSNNNKKQQQLV